MPLDAVIEPPEAVSREWSNGAQKWIHVPRGWRPDLRIIFDGAELFARGELLREPIRAPAWTRSITVRPSDVDWERGEFRLRVSVPPDVRLWGARVYGKPIVFADINSRQLQSAPIPIELHDAQGVVEVRIAAVRGDDRRVMRLKVDLPLIGLWFNHEGAWERHSPSRELNVGELRRRTCLVHVPILSDNSGSPWIAIQGHREVGVPTKRPSQFRDLAGWGQSLELAQGRYNRPPEDRRVTLASRVIDRGCVLDCVQLLASDSVIVRLQDPIEPSDEHSIVAWTSRGHLAEIGREYITPTQDGRSWQFDRSSYGHDFSGSIVAVAVAYRGKRLGAWWDDDWCRCVRNQVRDGQAKEAAQLIRWFQLPVVDPRCADTIRALVEEHGLAFAEAWLVWADAGMPPPSGARERIEADDLRPPIADPAWYEVVRYMFADWNPRPEDVEQLATDFEVIASDLNELLVPLPLASLVERLSETAPLLIGRLVRQWLSDRSQFTSQARWLLSALANQIRPPTRDRSAADEWDDSDPRVAGLQISTPFVEEMLKTAQLQSDGIHVEPHAAENLQTLLQHPDVPRLVALHLLESLELALSVNHVTT